MKPSAVFRQAKFILFERGWSQHRYVADDGSVCLRTALALAQGKRTGFASAESIGDGYCTGMVRPDVEAVLREVTGDTTDQLAGLRLNESRHTTFTDVLDVLDKAEKIAEQREALS